METTFISIHDLTENATILYSSDSVVDVLGYTPDELVTRSAWEFFPQDEVPYAKSFHQSRVAADKAAVLVYCRVKGKQGERIDCECCFTVVYDVIVVCTSIYQRGLKSDKRAVEAPLVRRIFSSSPKDPRYHMLTHISAKFSRPAHPHEPRAALFLNRFTRTLTIMYATQGLKDVIGIPAETMRGRSFYFCISENCLQDAVKCLENAKANNSVAYLRFWFRDPRIDDRPDSSDDSDEDHIAPDHADDDNDDDHDHDDISSDAQAELHEQGDLSDRSESSSDVLRSSSSMEVEGDEPQPTSRNSSGDSTHPADTHEAIFGSDTGEASSSSSSSSTQSPEQERTTPNATNSNAIELEAVISCASDGLVVCLRRARPSIPPPTQRSQSQTSAPKAGIFAAPWAIEPVLPPLKKQRTSASLGPTLTPSLNSLVDPSDNPTPTHAVDEVHQTDYMNAIREQAILAWAVVGINGSLANYGTGNPREQALPLGGLPMWSPAGINAEECNHGADMNPSARGNTPAKTWKSWDTKPNVRIFGDPGLKRKNSSGISRSVDSSKTVSGNGTPYPQ